jgi:3-isopropylmalate/(R)-2-methylmalate dehydratase small subunit
LHCAASGPILAARNKEEGVSKKENWAGTAVLAGAAAVGSAALAAALLYSNRRKERANKPAKESRSATVPKPIERLARTEAISAVARRAAAAIAGHGTGKPHRRPRHSVRPQEHRHRRDHPGQVAEDDQSRRAGPRRIRSLRTDPDNLFDSETFKGSPILIAGDNFGCGSSREHAAWALLDLGIKAVIAPSFSDIFSGNAFKNGILTVVMPQEQVDRLLEVAQTDPIAIDLDAQTVTTPFQDRFTFEIDPFRKHCLLNGLDEVGLTLARGDAIGAFEATVADDRPFLAQGTGAAA